MGFQKGKPRHPDAGRKPGSKNKKTVLRVKEILAESGINPTEEILKLIPILEPEEQLKAWGLLLSYCEVKPREDEAPPIEGTEDLAEKLRDVSDSNLIKVIEFQRKADEEN